MASVRVIPREITNAGRTDSGHNPRLSLTSGRIPALDGIRGLAILLVLIHHGSSLERLNRFDTAVFNLADSAWIGVDLFFVLSGFLITGILLDARGSRGYFRNFYARRVLRIFPLYYLALVILFWVYRPLLAPADADLAQLHEKQVWYWSYLYNFWVGGTGGWPRAMHFVHFWSLAIEEQFYLVWPAIVLLLNRRQLRFVCFTCIGAAFALRCLLIASGAGSISVYVSTPCRIDSLALGALVAVAMRDESGREVFVRRLHWAGWIAAAVLGLFLLTFGGFRMHYAISPEGQETLHTRLLLTAGFSAVGVLFASFLVRVLTAPAQSRLQSLFSHASLRLLGKHSYCIYIIHWPLMMAIGSLGFTAQAYPTVLGSQLPGQIATWIVLALLSLAIAFLSWHLFEVHFLRLKRYFTYESGAEPRRQAGPATEAFPVQSALRDSRKRQLVLIPSRISNDRSR